MKREEVMGGWRKLHDERLHTLYSFPTTIKVIKLSTEETGGSRNRHERDEKYIHNSGRKS
jgi:hypothetical protein